MIRTNGRVVEGHVDAPTPEEAYGALSDNGIVTESLRPDPRPEERPEPEDEQEAADPTFRQAIDSALDSASMQVAFDSLTEQYKGKKVWVLDRDKIRKRVAQVVDQVLAEAQRKAETDQKTRELVQEAIKGMFADNRNIASERTAESIAAERAAMAAQAAERAAQAAADKVAAAAAAQITAAAAVPRALPAPGTKMAPSDALEQQIQRLSGVVLQAEKALASIISAAARVGRGGGGGGPRRSSMAGSGPRQNEVLLEIFKTNLALQRGIEGEVLDMGAAEEAAQTAPDGAPPASNGEAAGATDGATPEAGPGGQDGDAPA
jgi:hypothetical protein